MINRILSLFKKKPLVTDLKTVAGYNFRVLDPGKMPNVRRIRFFMEEYARDWGLTKEDLLAYIQYCIKNTDLNRVDHSNMVKENYALLTTLESIIKSDYQYKPFLKAACLIILLPNEDLNKVENSFIQEKLRLCQQHPEIEAFFLSTIRLLQLNIQKQSDLLKESDWQPSMNQKRMESSFYQKINSTIYETGNS